MKRKLVVVTDGRDAGLRLDQVVQRHATSERGVPCSRKQAQALIEGGHVRVDGRRQVKSSHRVEEHARIEVEVQSESGPGPGTRLAGPGQGAAQVVFRPEWVLFEDDSMLVVDKPSGVLSDATRDPRRDHMVAAAARWLAEQGGRPCELRAVHRLDAETSGVLMMARTRHASAVLGDMFRAREIAKIYTALLALPGDGAHDWQPGHEWLVTSYLAHRGGRTVSVRSGGDPAETAFRVLETGPDWALVEARPHTGRTHQIRVHAGQSPILGDPLYAPVHVRDLAPRLMLHASRLELVHPVTRQRMCLEAAIAEDMVRVLGGLRSRA